MAIPSSPPKTLWQLLLRAAKLAAGKGLVFQNGGIDSALIRVPYDELVARAQKNGKALIKAGYLRPGEIVAIYFTSHQENIEWCWSIIAAGAIPVVLSPLSNDAVTLQGQVANLSRTFEQPTVLTGEKLLPLFKDPQGLQLRPIEALVDQFSDLAFEDVALNPCAKEDELAILLLTSGSTGHSKAVRYSHAQLWESVRAKSALHQTNSDVNFMSWTSFDHSANFCEIHINALYTASDQYHVSTHDLVAQPEYFFPLLSKHRVGYTFLPNFFLNTATDRFNDLIKDQSSFDLSCVKVIMCGGEANRTSTIAKAEAVLTRLKAQPNSVKAAYGLSETCSAAFYNFQAPSYDSKMGYIFASAGKPVPEAISVRIVDEDGCLVPGDSEGEGSIQLQGPMVFQSYHNNAAATESCMTSDGWFDTGDVGRIDAMGHLLITGRKKEIVILNGNNYSSFEIEHAIESSGIDGLNISFTATFSVFDKQRESEGIVVLFNPTQDAFENPSTLRATVNSINKALLRVCSQRALEIVPLPKEELPKSTIGKLSRAKLKAAYQGGRFDKFKIAKEDAVVTSNRLTDEDTTAEEQSLSPTSHDILDILAANTGLPKTAFLGQGGILAASIDSIVYIRIKRALERKFFTDREFPMATLVSASSLQELEQEVLAIRSASGAVEYDPIVTVRSGGDKLPLFCLHPGSGEFLWCLPVAKLLTDRPIYAVRSRGMGEGETVFHSYEEMLDSYEAAVRRVQPRGPYAFLGYCFGGYTAYELSKRLEATGEEVAFIGLIDNPLNPAAALDERLHRTLLIDVLPVLTGMTTDEALDFAIEVAHLKSEEIYDELRKRLGQDVTDKLDLSPQQLARWCDVDDSILSMVMKYAVSGSVSKIDMFVADPMPRFNISREKWCGEKIPAWVKQVADPDEFKLHSVPGDHFSLFNEAHIHGFIAQLQKALVERNI